jgi:hypothetical protein
VTPFSDVAHAEEDLAIMREMLRRMRTLARDWERSRVVVRDGVTWIRVPDRAALLECTELTTVGFFGQARAEVDHSSIHELEERIVDTLEEVPGVLSYFNLVLEHGRHGNLILCDGPDVPVRWHEHRIHVHAVELAPHHYHSARLHNGIVRSPLLGDAELDVLRTRYLDFDAP